jgi:meiosis induction protein kinase IME2/SME1
MFIAAQFLGTLLDSSAGREEKGDKMTVTYEYPSRGLTPTSMASLTDRFELMKEVGDGSFGSVAVARVRTAGSNVARRGTLV